MRKLTPKQISPFVRGANYATMPPFDLGGVNYAFQLFYAFSGKGKGRVNENCFDLKPGLIAVYGPGDEFRFHVCGDDTITFATICFSWEALDAPRVAVANRVVREVNEDYWRLADPKVSIAGLPEIPFVLELPAKERQKTEELLRDTGNSWRKSTNPLRYLRHKAALLEIIYNLMKFYHSTSGHIEHPVIHRFREYIEGHYFEELNRSTISRFIGISQGYLTALLRKELNTNVTAYLTAIRMRNAMELLQYSNLSVKEIAAAVGFRDYNYFVIRFRQLHGKPPGAMRLQKT